MTFLALLVENYASGQDSPNPCDKYCFYILDPVCAYNGTDYRYFGNECFMERHNGCFNDSKFPRKLKFKFIVFDILFVFQTTKSTRMKIAKSSATENIL